MIWTGGGSWLVTWPELILTWRLILHCRMDLVCRSHGPRNQPLIPRQWSHDYIRWLAKLSSICLCLPKVHFYGNKMFIVILIGAPRFTPHICMDGGFGFLIMETISYKHIIFETSWLNIGIRGIRKLYCCISSESSLLQKVLWKRKHNH